MLSAEEFIFEFITPANTSRGSYQSKKVLVLRYHTPFGIFEGEASPLPDLSVDGQRDLLSVVPQIEAMLLEKLPEMEILDWLRPYPSLQFALECCLLGSKNPQGPIFDTAFTRKEASIKINGLIWMSDIETMTLEAQKKAAQGFRCLKFKIGAMDHDAECRMIESVRKQFNPFQLEIRLDANGAFQHADALQKLKDFGRYDIHSVEQPIKAGSWLEMEEICSKSKLSIALDEELIGLDERTEGLKMLQTIKPKYIIIKPTLLGGFTRSNTWLTHAAKLGIGWWGTSALESNLGLSHITQWISTKNNLLFQGLGTGALYKKNFTAQTRLDIDTTHWIGGTGLSAL